MTSYSLTTERSYLPLYLSTHSHIPNVLIHELTVAWMLIGMLFNGVLIYYLIASKKYRSPVFMLVLFLANTDFVVCLSIACVAGFVWPIYVLPMNTWIVCKLVFYTFEVSSSTSSYYLILFAALRFYQLCFPLKARVRVTSSFVRSCCLLILWLWLIGWSPYLFSYNLIDVLYDGKRAVVFAYTGSHATVSGIAFLAVNTCIPGISIPVLHLMKYIGVALTKTSSEAKQEKKNTDIRALMIIIVMFYICWFPPNMYMVMYKHLPNHWPLQNKLLLLFIYITGTNNALNPVVYCLAASSVRSDIFRILCKKKEDRANQRALV